MFKKHLILITALLMLTAGSVLLICKSALAETSPRDLDAQSKVQEIDLWVDQDNTLHVQLMGHGPFNHAITGKEQGRMHSLLPETAAAESLVRLYRLDELDTPLKSLLVRNTDDGTLLTWVWNREPEFQVRKSQDQVLFQFARADTSTQAAAPQSGLSTLDQEKGHLQQDSLFPGMREEYTGEPVSIDLQNAEVEHVLRLITHHTEYNLILDEEVQGKISLRLKEVPWDLALDLALDQKDLGMVRKGNIIRVTTADRLEAEKERRRRSREAELEEQQNLRKLEPLQQRFIQINYARADELQPGIENFLSERGRVTQDERTNTLIIRDTPTNLEEIVELIQNLDRPEPQVLIEARVVYATESFRRELGIDWHFDYAAPISGALEGTVNMDSMNLPGQLDNLMALGGGLERFAGSMFSLDAQLRLGEVENQSSTISAPQVMTLNNQEAEIEQGTRIRRQVEDERGTRTEYEDAVLRLVVQPQITPENNLILNLEVRDDTPAEDGIDTKLTRTTLLVDDGETIVIGGIKKLLESERLHRVPGLSNIPLLGRLFSSEFVKEGKDELLIFIRPKIQ